jgi:hypothetical protein
MLRGNWVMCLSSPSRAHPGKYGHRLSDYGFDRKIGNRASQHIAFTLLIPPQEMTWLKKI